MKNNQIQKVCPVCQKEFLARNWKNSPGVFCSQTCQRKGRKRKPEIQVNCKCQLCEKEFTQPKHWKSPGKFCSIQCMSKVRGKNMTGENHPNWRGGIRKRSWKYTKLINELKKTKKKCERCDDETKLEAHHKIKTSERPDLLEDLDNIEFICKLCHAKEHPKFEGMILRKKSGSILNCKVCSKEFYVAKCRIKNSKYCSVECSLHITSIARFRNKLIEK